MTPVALTCGDPAGVGPDVIRAWLEAHPAEEVAVVGPGRWLESLPGTVRKVVVGLEEYEAVPGKPDAEGALVAWAALERAAQGCRKGEFSAVVTGPVSKEKLAAIGWNLPGQTEFFAARWGGDATMAFAGGKLRVVLLTWHIPLREVPEHLTEKEFLRTVTAAEWLGGAHRPDALSDAASGQSAKRMGDHALHPRIAVCGLNPHAGEGGMLGTEEKDIIDPILDRLRPRFPGLSRTLPGDTVFARQARGEFDVAIALYHDQGLAPLKLIDFDSAVNITLGLPFVRTSPDHGTAYSLAGTGKASPRSFANAVEWARKLVAVAPRAIVPSPHAR